MYVCLIFNDLLLQEKEVTSLRKPQGTFNSHRTKRDQKNWRIVTTFLAFLTTDLHFEASYFHSGVREPGCYLHSTTTDTTHSARPIHTKKSCTICQPPTS